ncbi:MAG: helix-turn-helix transcriptional regulator [Oscillospiraceae bacterium]|nr:helix-turn-helix transcriptional regulator [Oscillospiraceae bacterium]
MKRESMGAVIAEKRKELGITQLELAGRMGVTDKAVSKWERDLSYPDINSLPKLAEILGMSVDELMLIKSNSAQQECRTPISEILHTVFSAVCLAMGVAVVVLSIMKKLDPQTAIIMLGIGLACGGIDLLQKR